MYMDCILLFTTSQCKPNLVNNATGKTSKCLKSILDAFISMPKQIKCKS